MPHDQISHENELPVGTYNFKDMVIEARKNKWQFVDKTFFIQQIVKSNEKVMLFTRPRRFGKSTNLSMLYYFLSQKDAQENRDLFKGLEIESNPEIMAEQGTYPVIMLNLKGLKLDTLELHISKWSEIMANLYEEWKLRLFPFLNKEENENLLEKFTAILKGKGYPIQIQEALQQLTYYIHCATGLKSWILIDEYDSAIYHAYTCGYHEQALGILSAVLGHALKDNEYLHKAVLTGILRIAKENLFSGLNNIGVYSFQTPHYKDVFGFTAHEVRHLITQRTSLMESHEVEFQTLSAWYNGYECDGVTLYNPWSIACYMQRHQLLPYWVNTGRDDILRTMLCKGHYSLIEKFSQLIITGSVKARLSEFLDFSVLEKDPDQIWSIMVASGYLKVINPNPESEEEHTLVSPNYEVTRALKSLAASTLTGAGPTSFFARGLRALSQEGNPLLLIEALQIIFQETISFHDLQKGGENFVHGIILGVVGDLNEYFHVKSNRESGEGRYDIALFPKEKNPNKRGIIIELKLARELTENEEPNLALRLKQLRTLANKAIEQIINKNYAEEFHQKQINEVLMVAMAFAGKYLEGTSRTLYLNSAS